MMRSKILDLTISSKKFQVCVIHVAREPWISIVKFGQQPSWNAFVFKNFDVTYVHAKNSYIANFLDTSIERWRWHKGRNFSYAISYLLMVFLFPWRGYIPKISYSNEAKSGLSQFAKKINIPDLVCTIRWKQIAFLQYFLDKTSSQYVILTNSSSILNFKSIDNLVENLEIVDGYLYAGPINSAHDCEFASGSFTVMNRKTVQLLMNNVKKIPLHVMPDIGFGTAFKKLGIQLMNINTLSIDTILALNNIKNSELLKYCHFRLKSGDLEERGDVDLMEKLIFKLQSLRI